MSESSTYKVKIIVQTEDKTSAGLRRAIAEALADHSTHENPPRGQAARGGE